MKQGRSSSAILPAAVVLVSLCLGCAHTVRTSRADLVADRHVVTALVLWSGEEMRFDARGGFYDRGSKRFLGRTPDGIDKVVDSQSVKRVRFARFVRGAPEEAESDRVTFMAMSSRRSIDVITSLVTTRGESRVFDELGGRFGAAPWQVRGFTPSGDPIAVPLEEVLYVEIRRTNPWMSGAAAMGALAVVGVVVAVIVHSTRDSWTGVFP